MRTSENGKGAVDEKSMAPLFYGLAKKQTSRRGKVLGWQFAKGLP